MERRLVTYGDGEVLLEEAQRIGPGEGEIAGSTLYSLLSPGTELALIREGGNERSELPIQLGYSAVFEVDGVGPGVEGFEIGDIVLCEGPHESYQCVQTERAVKVPESLDPAKALFARMMSITSAAMVTSRVRPGQMVGVVGLGMVGQMAVRVFDACGFDVVAVEIDLARRELAPSGVAVDDTIPLESCDLVVECSGREAGALTGAYGLRSGGELVLTGVPWRKTADLPLFDLTTLIFHRYLTVRSGWEWQVPYSRSEPIVAGPSMRQNVETALRWLDEGRVDVAGLADVVLSSDALQAYSNLRERRSPAVTQILKWS